VLRDSTPVEGETEFWLQRHSEYESKDADGNPHWSGGLCRSIDIDIRSSEMYPRCARLMNESVSTPRGCIGVQVTEVRTPSGVCFAPRSCESRPAEPHPCRRKSPCPIHLPAA
jgi:hypothetical protein